MRTRINILRILNPKLNIRSKGCPRMNMLEYNVDRYLWNHNNRFPRISCGYPRVNIWNKLIRILYNRLNSMRRNLKVKTGALVFRFVVIMNFSINWSDESVLEESLDCQCQPPEENDE